MPLSTRPRDYDGARTALYALVSRGVVLGLESMRAALAARGNLQERIPAVHVAGTNGKGSVAAMVAAGLQAAGRRVGLYTSPHLHRFAERIQVDGKPCPDSLIAERAWGIVDAMEAGRLPALTFFEATTLLAWEIFAYRACDVVVLEVGLGGRLDATNICAPAVTAITRIALDHEAILGNTLRDIAREKAGILKPGVRCIVGPELASGEAREAIDYRAGEIGASVLDAPPVKTLSVGEDLRTRVQIALEGGPLVLDMALPGVHQVGNAAVAAGILRQLGVGPEDLSRGLSGVSWPARLERIGDLLLDSAHNPDGARALCVALGSPGPTAQSMALVFGASSDKDWRSMLAILLPRFRADRRFFCAASQLRRAEEPSVLVKYAGGYACQSVEQAIALARRSVAPGGLVVVCGSIFVAAEARAKTLGVAVDPPVAM